MLALGVCTDEEYLLPSLVVLTSMADALPPRDRRNAAIRVMTPDLTRHHALTMAEVTRRLGFGSFDIRWDTPAPTWRVFSSKRITVTTYLRFHYTRQFVGRPYLAHLDSDILVLSDPTIPFNEVAESDIGLVRDTFFPAVGDGGTLPGVATRWPDYSGRPYFNAGTMWCQTAAMPMLRRGIAEVMARAGQHIRYNDQDALNLWGLRTDGIRMVDSAYNSFELDRFRQTREWVARPLGTAPPAVIHFVGPYKPWHETCPTTSAVLLYRRYLRQTRGLVERTGDFGICLRTQAPA